MQNIQIRHEDPVFFREEIFRVQLVHPEAFALKDVETQYMCLYTADRWEGELNWDCPEGELEWVPKEKVRELPLWDGDLVFFKLLEEEHPFFSLKLAYEGNVLTECVLDGRKVEQNG